MILKIYVDDETLRTLEEEAKELDRTVEDLAESAVANECSKVRNYKIERAKLYARTAPRE